MKNNFFLNNLNIEELKNSNNKNEISFVFNNLPNELSVTLGNYYRRVILSYTNGISIFAVRISNKKRHLESEFSTLEGLLETPPYLILNLRRLIISPKEEIQEKVGENFKLELDIENDSDDNYTVTAKDLKDLSGKLAILNPDLYFATLAPSHSLKIELYCERNWGYKRNEENFNSKSLDNIEGLISVDSNYNPVVNVSYSNDFIVTGLEEQNEKLILKIETNGSLSPKEVLMNALKLSLEINEKILGNLSEIEA